jgi:hypothetical protein
MVAEFIFFLVVLEEKSSYSSIRMSLSSSEVVYIKA